MKMMNIERSIAQMQIYRKIFGYDQQINKELLSRVPLVIQASANWGYFDQFLIL